MPSPFEIAPSRDIPFGPPTFNEFVQGYQDRIDTLELQKIELAQGVREFARADIERRLGNLIPRLNGETNVMNNRKILSVVDRADVLRRFQVPAELRRLLREENEPGDLQIEVTYNEKPIVSIANPATRNSVWISPSFMGYAIPMIASRTDSRTDLSLVEQRAMEYREQALQDERALYNHEVAKSLIGAIREIAFDSGALDL